MEQTPISDILNSNEPPAEVTEEVATPEVETEEAKAERLRDEKGRFVAKGDNETEEVSGAPPAPQEEPGNVPFAALRDERSKRQKYEEENAQLKAALQQFQQQPQPQYQEPQGPPDRWEDPEGYDQWLIGQAAYYAREQAVHAVQMQRIYSSAVRARATHEDYGEAHQVFGEMVQRNPSLFDQMMNADDPAEFAYSQAKAEMEIRQYGDLNSLIEARVQAKLQEQMGQVQNKLPSAPPTISDARSVGSRSGPAWSGPTPLSELLS